MDVSRVCYNFQWYLLIFKEVPRKGVSKKFHVAWHSSQLPEQKEGLFFCKKVCFFVPEQLICFKVIYMLQNI